MSVSNNSSNNNNNKEESNDDAIKLNRNTQYQHHPRPPYQKDSRKHYTKEDRLINTYYQLTYIEKMKVKELFREAYIKGFRMDQIGEFIYIKSKINVTYHFVQTLKQMQYEDDRFWFYEMARDSTAYMSCYREAIDTLRQLEKEMWLIIMNPKVETVTRVMATKEIHSITKTKVLLLRELPFITNLSKLYDLSDMDDPTNAKECKKKLQSHSEPRQQDRDYDTMTKDVFDDTNSSLVHTVLDNIRTRVPRVDADVAEDMNTQLNTLGYDTDPEVKAAKETKRKEITDRYIEKNLERLDDELGNVTSEDGAKVVKAAQDYRKTMAFFDAIVSKEHRESIKRISDITGEEEEEE